MASRAKLATVEDALNDLDALEAWRPALIAFYKADCWFQSAETLERGGSLSAQDRRMIEALQKAAAKAPRLRLAA